MTVSGFLITGLDFVGLWLMFTHLDDPRRLHADADRPALRRQRGRAARGRPADRQRRADRPPRPHRPARPDAHQAVPLLVQVCADNFSLRRFGQISQAVIVFAWWPASASTGRRRACWSRCLMIVSSGVIFFGLFVAFSCVQFWTTDSTEFANAFTYGGNTITQYPLSIYPQRAHQEPDLPAPDRLRELVPVPLPARGRRPLRAAVVAAVLLAGRRRRRARRCPARLADRRPPLHLDGELRWSRRPVARARPTEGR